MSLFSFNWRRWLRGQRAPASSKKRKQRRKLEQQPRVEQLEDRAVPATFTWTGNAGLADTSWNNPQNWLSNGVPAAPTGNLDDLVFPNLGAPQTTTNNIANGIFKTITIDSPDYVITGANQFQLGDNTSGNGKIIISTGASNNRITVPIRLGGSASAFEFIDVGLGGQLTLTGNLSSAAGTQPQLNKEGSGTLTLAGNNQGFAGPIKVVDFGGILVISHANALGDTSAGTIIGQNGQLQVDNSLATITAAIQEQITLNGPGISNDGAILQTAGNTTWQGQITLDSNTTLGVNAGTVLNLTGSINDNSTGYNLIKEGAGQIIFGSNNTYRGTTTINNGILTIQTPTGLGTGDNTLATATTVNFNNANNIGGTLQLNYVGGGAANQGFTVSDELVVLNGPGFLQGANRIGALDNFFGNNIWGGTVVLGSQPPNGNNVQIASEVGGLFFDPSLGRFIALGLNFQGQVVDQEHLPGPPAATNFSLTIGPNNAASGRLIFSNRNLYGGTTTLNRGTLTLRDSGALGDPLGGIVTILSGAALELEVDTGFDVHGRNLANDSATGVADRLVISRDVDIGGRGANNDGALRNISGINTFSGDIGLGVGPVGNPNVAAATSAIGVEPDPNPKPDNTYFTNDYSLTVTGVIRNTGRAGSNDTTLAKLGTGNLIVRPDPILVPLGNTYTGPTDIEFGWITVQHNNSLGTRHRFTDPQSAGSFAGGDTVEPYTRVFAGAALHLKPTVNIVGADLTLAENLELQGDGIEHPFGLISHKGALMSISGDNVVGGPRTVVPQNPVSSDLRINGAVAIGVENLGPIGTSSLTVTGRMYDGATAGSVTKLGSQRMFLHAPSTYTGSTSIAEGVVRLQHDIGLGLASSGTLSGTDQVFTTTATTVQAGAALELAPTVAQYSGGIQGGLQVWYESLILNGNGNTTAGAPVNPVVTIGVGAANDFSWRGPVTLNGNTPIRVTFTGANLNRNSPAPSLPNLIVDSTSLVGGTVSVGTSTFAVAAVTDAAQMLTFNGPITGGSFSLNFRNPNTNQLPGTAANVAWSNNPATLANNIRVALESLSSIGVGNVTVVTVPQTLGGIPGLGVDVSPNTRLSLFGVIQDGTPTVAITDFIKLNTGELFLSAVNTHRGATRVTGGIVTVLNGQALGSTGIAEVDTLTVTGVAGNTFNLTFDGSTTPIPLPFNATAIDIENALKALPSILNTGGTVSVSQISPVVGQFINTISFLGTLAGFDLTGKLTAAPAAGTPTLTVGQMTRGTGGTIVSDGAQLQLQGGLTIAGEPLQVQGTGVAAVPTYTPRWQQIGPAPINNGETPGNSPVTGRITGIAVDPTDSSVIYISVAGGGAFKTEDGGITWESLIDNVTGANLATGAIAIAPSDPRVIYVAAGEQNNATDSMYGRGILKSSDSGRTWVLFTGSSAGTNTEFDRRSISKIVVDPADANLIYVAVNGSGQTVSFANVGSDPDQNVNVNNLRGNGGIWVGRTNSNNPVTTVFRSLTSLQNDGGAANLTPTVFFNDNDDYTDLVVLRDPYVVTVPGNPASRPNNRFIFFAIGTASGVNPVTGLSSNAVYTATSFNALDNGPNNILGDADDFSVVSEAMDASIYFPVVAALPVPYWTLNTFPLVDSAIVPSPPMNGAAPIHAGVIKLAAAYQSPTGTLAGQGAGGPTYGSDLGTNPGPGQISVYAAVTFPDIYPFPAAGGLLRDFQEYQSTFREVRNMSIGFESTAAGSHWWTLGLTWGGGTVASPPVQPDTDPTNNTATSPTDLAGLTGPQNEGQGSFSFTFIADPSDPTGQTLYIGGQKGPYRSTNGGGNFAAINPGAGGVGLAKDFHAMAFDGTITQANRRLLVGGDGGLWRLASTAPFTWTDLNGNLPITHFEGLATHPTDPNIILAGAGDNGIVRYTGDMTWRRTDAGDGGEIHYDTRFPNNVYHVLTNQVARFATFTTASQQITITDPLGAAALSVGMLVSGPSIGPGTFVTAINVNTVTLNFFPIGNGTNMPLTFTPNGALRKSTDGGLTWTTLTGVIGSPFLVDNFGRPFSGQVRADNGKFPFVVDNVNTQRLVLGGGRSGTVLNQNGRRFVDSNSVSQGAPIQESLNGGNTWTNFGNNMDAVLGASRGGAATFWYEVVLLDIAVNQGAFVADPQFGLVTDKGNNTYDPDTIYAIVRDRLDNLHFLVTKNHGQSWVDRTVGIAGVADIADILVDPRNRDTVYLTRNVFDGVSATNVKVMKTTDAGRTWQTIGDTAGGLPNTPVHRIVVDPRNDDLYVGTDIGVYRSIGGGNAWAGFGEGLPNVQVKELELNQTTNTLTAATHGRSAFQLYLRGPQTANIGAIIAISGSNKWTGPIKLVDDTTFNVGGTQALQNGVSTGSLDLVGSVTDFTFNQNDPAKLIKTGQGNLILSASNSYAGDTILSDGILVINNSNALGSAGASEVQDIDLTGVTGTFSLTFTSPTGSQTTPVGVGALNAASVTLRADIEAALNALPNLGGVGGSVTVASVGGNRFRVTFGGNTVGFDQLAMTGTAIAPAGPPDPVISEFIKGHGGTYVDNSPNSTTLQLKTDLSGEPIRVGNLGTQPADGISINSAPNLGAINADASGPITYTGTLVMNTDTRIGVASGTTLTIASGAGGSGIVTASSNNFSLTKSLTGTLVLGSANSYGGVTTVREGALQVRNSGALGVGGTVASRTQVSAGAQLQVQGPVDVLSEQLILEGTGISSTGAMLNTGGNNIWRGDITLSNTPGNPTVNIGVTNSFETLDLRGKVNEQGGATSLNKVGLGRLIFDPAAVTDNSYTGTTTVTAGALRLKGNGTPGAGAPSLATVVSAGAALELATLGGPLVSEGITLSGAGTPEVQTVSLAGSTGGTFTLSVQVGAQTATTIALNANPAAVAGSVASALNNALALIGITGNPVTVVLVGTTYFVTFGGSLAGMNLAPMGFTVANGAAVATATFVDATGVVADGAQGALRNTAGPNTVANGPIILQAIAAVPNDPLKLANDVLIGVDGIVGSSLTISGANTIRDPGSVLGPMPAALPTLTTTAANLRKVGTGTLTLQDDNSYTGDTFVDAGIVNIRNAASLGVNGPEVQTLAVTGTSGRFQLMIVLNATTGSTTTGVNTITVASNTNIIAGMEVRGAGIPTGTTVTGVAGTTITLSANATATAAGVALSFGVATVAPSPTTGLTANPLEPEANVQTALNNALTALAPLANALTEVKLVGNVYTIALGGSLAGQALPLMLFTSTGVPQGTVARQGRGTGGTTVAAGGTLQLQNNITVQDESLTLNGTGVGNIGALSNLSGTNTWQRNISLGTSLIALNTNASIGSAAGSLIVNTAIRENTAGLTVTKFGAGTVEYQAGNTYTGLTTVNDGVLRLNNAGGNSLSGNLTVGDTTGAGDSAVARLVNAGEIPDTATVTVQSDGLFDLNNLAETVGPVIVGSVAFPGGHIDNVGTGALTATSLTMTGGRVDVRGGLLDLTGVTGNVNMAGGTVDVTVGGTFRFGGSFTATSNTATAIVQGAGNLDIGGTQKTFDVANGPQLADLRIGTPVIGAGGILKTGAGLLDFDGTYAGTTTINAGIFQADGTTGPISLNGGTLAGTGTVGTVTSASGGTVNPGNSPERLDVNGNVVWNLATTYFVEIDTSVVPDHDEIVATGTIDIAGATLSGAITGNPAIGTSYTILTADGAPTAISNRFLEFPGFANTAYINGRKFTVVYNTGVAGPDTVVITRARNLSQVMVAPSTGGFTSVFGQALSFNITVSSNEAIPLTGLNPSGNVNVTFTNTDTGASENVPNLGLNFGQATFTPTLPLNAANYSIAVTYGTAPFNGTGIGDGDFASSQFVATPFIINPAVTRTDILPSGNPSVFSEQVTFTATVTRNSPGAGNPGAPQTVDFFVNGLLVAGSDNRPLVGNVASFAYTHANTGTYTVTAHFNGAVFTTASTTTGLNTVTVASAANIEIGNGVSGAGIPNGTTVANVVGTTITLSANATATAAGVNLKFFGDPNFLASDSSSSITETVNRANTTTAVTSSTPPALTPTSTYGQNVTFTTTVNRSGAATVNPTAGSVTLFVDGTPRATNNLTGTNQTTFIVGDLTASGTAHVITAVYNGDGPTNYNASPAGTLTGGQTVNRATPGILFDPAPATSVFGNPVTFTVTLSKEGTFTNGLFPAGTVRLINQATTLQVGSDFTLAEGNAGVATFNVSNLAGGTFNLFARYLVSTNYVAVDSATRTHNVTPASTAITAFTDLPDPTKFGEVYTLMATVTSTPNTTMNSGTVQFKDLTQAPGSQVVGTAPVVNNVATVQVNSLPFGNRQLTAQYLTGGSDYTNSPETAFIPHTVSQATTSVGVVSNTAEGGPNRSFFGQNVTFTSTVSALPPSQGTPTAIQPDGFVRFVVSGVGGGTFDRDLAGATSTTSTATATLVGLGIGSHSVTAEYHPESTAAGALTTSLNYQAPGSPSGLAPNQLVIAADTQVVLTPASQTAAYGQGAVIATVTRAGTSPGTGNPTDGSVLFIVSNGVSTINVPVNLTGTNVARLENPPLDFGNYTSITARYQGNAPTNSFNQSAISAAVTQNVTKADANVVLVSDDLTPSFGETFTFSATVNRLVAGFGIPTGTMTFFVDGVQSGAAKVLNFTGPNGTATSDPVAGLAGGAHTVRVNYVSNNGNFNDQVAVGGSVNITPAFNVGTATPTVGVSGAPLGPTFGDTVTLTATVTNPIPNVGTVTFFVDNVASGTAKPWTGTPVQSDPILPANMPGGTRLIRAEYNSGGNPNFNNASSGNQNYIVTPILPTVSITGAAPVSPGIFIVNPTFTVDVNSTAGRPASGTVSFFVDGTLSHSKAYAGAPVTSDPITEDPIPGVQPLQPGLHQIRVDYDNGVNPSFQDNFSANFAYQVNVDPTAVTVTPSIVSPTTYGRSITFNADISTNFGGGLGRPTAGGTVTFFVDNVPSGTAKAWAGTGPVTSDPIVNMPFFASPHTVEARYSGFSFYLPKNGSTTHSISKATSTVTVGTTNANATFGLPTITATITPPFPAGGTPTGTATFQVANTLNPPASFTRTVNVVAGVATLDVTLAVGVYDITADYIGDGATGNFNAVISASNTVSQTITAVGTTATLTGNPTSGNARFGEAVVFSVIVSPNTGTATPTGFVNFVIDGGAPTSRPVVGGQASLPAVNNLSVSGSPHNITATYVPDTTNFTGDPDAIPSYTVLQANTTATIISGAPNPSVPGQLVTFTVRINVASPGPGAVAPDGTVDFFIDGSVTPAAGGDDRLLSADGATSATATFPTAGLAAGVHQITARYNGDATQNRYAVSALSANFPHNVDVLPVANAGGPYATTEGNGITLNGTGSSDADGVITSYAWDIGNNGSFDITTASATVPVSWASLNTFGVNDGAANVPIVLRVTDNLGGQTTSTPVNLAVFNAAPTIALTGGNTVPEGTLYFLNLGAVTDPGADTVTAWTINWGDGTTTTGTGSPTGQIRVHSYANEGSFNITVDLQDDDSGAGFHLSAGTKAVTVTNVGTFLSGTLADQLVVDNNANLQADVGDIIEYTATITNNGPDNANNVSYAANLDPNQTLVTPAVAPVNTALFSDNFNRTASTNLGGNWTEQAGNTEIDSNRFEGVDGALVNLATVNGAWETDVRLEAGFDLTATAPDFNHVGLIARYQGTGDQNMYLGRVWTVGSMFLADIFRNINGDWVSLGIAAIGGPTGTMRFEAVGPALRLFVNNVLVLTTIDSTFREGRVGIRLGNRVGADNFTATRLGSGSFTDNFNRADSADIGDSYAETPVDAVAGDYSIQGNRLMGVGGFINVAALTSTAVKDVSVKADINLVGTGFEHAGVVARYQGTGNNNMYAGLIFTFGGTEYFGLLWKSVNGVATTLDFQPVSGPTGNLRLDVVGSALKLYYNEAVVASAFDNSITGPGLAGVRSSNQAYDNFSVTPLVSNLGFTDNFNRADNTILGSRFKEAVGDFSVQGNRAVVTGPSFINTAAFNEAHYADVSVQADINMSGSGFTHQGVVARYQGSGDQDMYAGVVWGTPGAYNVSIFRNIGGGWAILTSQAAPASVGTLRLEVVGPALRLFFNGALVGSTTDTMIKGPGLVGIRAGGAGQAMDNFSVQPLTGDGFLDVFARPDTTNLGLDYTEVMGNMSIVSSQLQATAAGVNLTTMNNAQEADVSVFALVTLAGPGSQADLVARYAGPGDTNMYIGRLTNIGGTTFAQIFRNVGGILTQLVSQPSALVGGYLRFDVQGSSLGLFLEGTPVAQATDYMLRSPGLAGVRGTQGVNFDTFTVTPFAMATQATTNVSRNLGVLTPGQSVQTTYRAAVNNPLPANVTTVGHSGTVNGTDSGTGIPYSAVATNVVSRTVVANPDLRVAITGPGETLTTNNVTFTLTYTNRGTQDDTGVTLNVGFAVGGTPVNMVLQGGSTFNNGVPAGWTPGSGSNFNLAVGTVPVGGSFSVTLVVRVNQALTTPLDMTATATIFDDTLQGADLNLADNLGTHTLRVRGANDPFGGI